jgi:DNA polymerase epsilon subunit 1
MARNKFKNKKFVKVIPKDNIKAKKDNNDDNNNDSFKDDIQKEGGEDKLDFLFGFQRVSEGEDRVGWLINMHPTETLDETIGIPVSAVDYYFIEQDGSTFKVTIHKFPYFYIDVPNSKINEVEGYLKTKYSKYVFQTTVQKRENLELKNHLFGVQKTYIKIEFKTISDLLHVRSEIFPFVQKNWQKQRDAKEQNNGAANLNASQPFLEYEYEEFSQNVESDHSDIENDDDLMDDTSEASFETYLQRKQRRQQRRQKKAEFESTQNNSSSYYGKQRQRNPFEYIVDMREYDIPFYMRCAIDMNVRVGYWYQISFKAGHAIMKHREDLLARGEPRVLAFDIETTKLPLKFPDASFDSVMMISYMIDGQGYLIINRQCVSEDIEDFEYTPKPEYEGPFQIFNEKDELSLLKRFFSHIQEVKPNIYVTFNGDFFDWPFIHARANTYNINMTKEIGVYQQDGEYKCRFASHMDAYKWVQRDSYLPHGSHGLKAVTKAKLGYDPVEIDPEDMVRFALEKPQLMASYSVSDAVATYYLYMKYVHPFIFSLCSIIPMNPDDVLRKGSGTLCESLLMVQAHGLNIVFPNKQVTDQSKFHNGHLLESETYIGGHVEAVESGVFRADLPVRFDLDESILEQLINDVDNILRYTIEEEGKMKFEHITNYQQVQADVLQRLNDLKSNAKNRREQPNIYHLDVAAMYPNIILTNRLQPSAIVNEEVCAACEFNNPKNNCKRWMDWNWRGDYIPANKSEYNFIVGQLEAEKFPLGEDKYGKKVMVQFNKLPEPMKQTIIVKRLKEYSKKVYKRSHVVEGEERKACVCQRENSFYVDTVRAFRDRRYKFKDDLKFWKGQLDTAVAEGHLQDIQNCKNMLILYDSLQLAHKCILNSFYGYVMRRGARWFSMEMAGIVTTYGARIIKEARNLIDGIGRPLELDTDGIWTLLPQTFPENYKFQIAAEHQHLYDRRSAFIFSFPCVMLNHRIKLNFSNPQYQMLVDKTTHTYQTVTECSILFEVDGPYAAMVLPGAIEEGKKLKKRYAVFNHDKTLAELKGFEIKRRGELKLIKIFQSQVFEHFLEGKSLEECYKAVAKIADYWLDMLYSKGEMMEDEELISLISCSNSMSRSLSDYDNQKTTAICTAKRLSEFLGDQILKDNGSSGLQCKFIIANQPAGASIVDRAIPVAIFAAETPIRNHYLKKWLKDSNYSDHQYNIREILDWEYYIKRLASSIQKIITIPAALQMIENPVVRVPHPQWLIKKLDSLRDQSKITFRTKKRDFSLPSSSSSSSTIDDIENIGEIANQPKKNFVPIVTYFKNSSDVSDGGNGGSGSSGVSTSSSSSFSKAKKRRRSISDQESDDLRTISTPLPNCEENYDAWLMWLKAKWRVQRITRKRIKNSMMTFSSNDPSSSSSSLSQTNTKRRPTKQLMKQLYGSSFISNPFSSSTTGNYIQEQRMMLYTKEWHIIQIAEIPNSPGQFKIWCMIENTLFPILISIPRIFYIHSHQKNPNNIEESIMGLQKVERTLPHSKPLHYLYQFTFNEYQYQRLYKDIQNITNHSEVEGIYEENVSPLLRAILQFGSICKVDKMYQNLAMMTSADNSEPFEYHQLGIVPQKQNTYLSTQQFKFAYLYASFGETRAVYSLLFEHLNVAYVYIISSVSQVNNPSSIMQLKKTFFASLFPSSVVEGEVTDDQATTSIHLQFFKQKDKAYSQLNHRFEEYKQQRNAPTIVIVQSTNDLFSSSHWISHSCPKLREFPYLSFHYNDKDHHFPAFGWEAATLKLVAKRWSEAKEKFKRLCSYCNDFQIPIGNLPKDFLLFSNDVLYSRLLQKQKQLLWTSESISPDLGNRFLSNFASFSSMKKFSSTNNTTSSTGNNVLLIEDESGPSFEDEMEFIERSRSGCYNTITIDIQLRNLAINSILVSQYVNDIEEFLQSTSKSHFLSKSSSSTPSSGDQSSSNDNTTSTDHGDNKDGNAAEEIAFTLDEKAICFRAFRVLKTLVNQWNIKNKANPNYEVLKEHLYRWISSPKALLFDPALHSFVKDLMKRIFYHLLSEFRKLGAIIVYANVNQIIINTNKTCLEDAKTYCDFILKVIRSRPVFSHLHLDVQKFWALFLFSDSANYAGVLTSPSASSSSSSNQLTIDNEDEENISMQNNGDDDNNNNHEVINQWNIEKYLPLSVQPHFSSIISSYLSQLYRHYYHRPTINDNDDMIIDVSSSSSSSSDPSSSTTKPTRSGPSYVTPEAHINILKSTISQRMYNLVHDIQRLVVPVGEENTAQFPKLAGSYLSTLRSPALEFVKNICHVLSLDRSLSSEIIILRKVCLFIL